MSAATQEIIKGVQCGPNMCSSYMMRLPPLNAGYVTAATHVIAALGVILAAVGASAVPHTTALPNHGSVLLVFTILLRVALLKDRMFETVPYSPTGPELSIAATLLFISNSLVSLGCLIAPDHMLSLLAYSALDVTAAWLNMVALAKGPALPRFSIIISFLGFAADAHVASVVCGRGDFAMYTMPAFILKSIHNIFLMVSAAIIVVDRDTAKRDAEETKKQ
jgi:hypothetical protein